MNSEQNLAEFLDLFPLSVQSQILELLKLGTCPACVCGALFRDFSFLPRTTDAVLQVLDKLQQLAKGASA